MTPLGRWMAFPAVIGLFLGLVRGQVELALLSLSVLVWLAIEWLLFTWRVWVELPRLRFERTVNGRSEPKGLLWAGRTVTITVRVTTAPGTVSELGDSLLGGAIGPTLLIRDVIPENLEVLPGEQSEREADGRVLGANERELRTRASTVTFTYTARVRSAGHVELPGIRLRLQDAQGFFLMERFVPLSQSFRVLPPYVDSGEIHPTVKRTNSLPQHGIHRLQRSGLGSELLELREYVAGDPPKAIAWKVSARRDKLMTRQYESEVPVRVHLLIDGSMSSRMGGYGFRLLDQMNHVAASIAKAAISVGDPVGVTLLDERSIRRVPSQGGERGFHRLLEAMADFSINPAPSPQPLTQRMISTAMKVAGERFPELLDRHVNRIPFTIFPILPMARRRFHEQCLLAGVLAELYQLSALKQAKLINDPGYLSIYIQRFLTATGAAWMAPMVTSNDWWVMDGVQLDQLGDELVKCVIRARDNEVFVILGDLLETSPRLSRLLPAVKMALGRHHRVAFVCPSPTFRRPTASSIEPPTDSATDLLAAAEQIKARTFATGLQRELRRLGASVACSGEKEAIHLVLSEMELARTGRLSSAGGRR